MNSLDAVLHHPAVDRLAYSLLHFLWQGLLVAIVFVVLIWLLRRRSANARYVTGCLALLAMLVCPVATWMLSARIQYAVAPTAVVGHVRQIIQESQANEQPDIATAENVRSGEATARAMVSQIRSMIPSLNSVVCYFVPFWFVGVSLLSLRLVLASGQMHRVKHRATVLGVSWQVRLNLLAQRLGLRYAVQLLESDRMEAPITVGWLRPVILLPVSALTGLSPSQLQAILLHELAHIRRHDYLVNLIQSAVDTLLFYHPAVWLVSRHVRKMREHCCDDIAVAACGNPIGYSDALTKMAELGGGQSRLALAARDGDLKARIHRVLGIVTAKTANNRPQLIAGLGSSALVIMIVTTLGAHGWTSRTPVSSSFQVLVDLSPPVEIDQLKRRGEDGRSEVSVGPTGRLVCWGSVQAGGSDAFRLVDIPYGLPLAIQVTSLTDRFRPFLKEEWVTANGTVDSNTDAGSGRGRRAFDIIRTIRAAPDNWANVEISGFEESHGDYLVCVWQPREPWDLDPGALGFAASPIELDESGIGGLPDSQEAALPAIDYAGDIDAFQVKVERPGLVSVTVDWADRDLGVVLRVCDLQGLTIAEGGGEPQSESLKVKVHASASSLLYIVVRSRQPFATGRYALRVQTVGQRS